VISNLLTDALKFTPEHGSVDLRLERVTDRARLVVHDSGIGISPELLPRIFDRFQQGDNVPARTHTGLGLGLAIVKHLVEQHGGQIAAASGGPGCGSIFTVTFPLLRAGMASPDQPASSVVDPALLAGVRVLVVEDEADTRATLRALLEQFGARPTVVATAREALTAMQQGHPDVLLSDIALPGDDGCALIRRIRTSVDAVRLPAAALSARVDDHTKADAVDAGFQEYLTKPIDPTVLAQALARLVNRATDVPHAP
jgi:CheY-like chemotaxis protein